MSPVNRENHFIVGKGVGRAFFLEDCQAFSDLKTDVKVKFMSRPVVSQSVCLSWC
jgi:hypothetical protein